MMIRLFAFKSALSLAALLVVVSSQRLDADNRLAETLTDDTRSAAREFVENARRVRIDKYGNVHFVINKSIETYDEIKSYHDGKKIRELVTEIKYWSLEDRYFRVDSTVLKSVNRKEKIGSRRRLIVRPEGFVALFSESPNRPLAIGKWGTAEDGLNLLFQDDDIIQGAARLTGGLPADLMVNELFSAESHLPDLYKVKMPEDAVLSKESLTLNLKWTSPSSETLENAVLSQDGKTLELNWRSYFLDDPSLPWAQTMRCDPKNGVVLSDKYQAFREGKVSSWKDITREYDYDRFGCIPARDNEISYTFSVMGNGPPEDYVYVNNRTLLKVGWNPVPLGMFSLEAQGFIAPDQIAIWVRRLLMILVGLLLVGIYYFMRLRRRRKAN